MDSMAPIVNPRHPAHRVLFFVKMVWLLNFPQFGWWPSYFLVVSLVFFPSNGLSGFFENLLNHLGRIASVIPRMQLAMNANATGVLSYIESVFSSDGVAIAMVRTIVAATIDNIR